VPLKPRIQLQNKAKCLKRFEDFPNLERFAPKFSRKIAVLMKGIFLLVIASTMAGAHIVSSGGGAHVGGVPPPLWRMGLWVVLFVISACLAGAETAITYYIHPTFKFSLKSIDPSHIKLCRTLWPWKVKKIAEEEGADSPFRCKCM
jgi:hypothetical protein